MTGSPPGPPAGSAAEPPGPRGRHGSAVEWCGRGILLLGPPGSGKSDLLAGLLLAGGRLVADDLVALRRRGPSLLAGGVSPRGLIELRGGGIFRLATTSEVPVDLCVDLAGDAGGSGQRLPERRSVSIAGVDVPVLRLPAGRSEPVAAVLVALFGARAG